MKIVRSTLNRGCALWLYDHPLSIVIPSFSLTTSLHLHFSSLMLFLFNHKFTAWLIFPSFISHTKFKFKLEKFNTWNAKQPYPSMPTVQFDLNIYICLLELKFQISDPSNISLWFCFPVKQDIECNGKEKHR